MDGKILRALAILVLIVVNVIFCYFIHNHFCEERVTSEDVRRLTTEKVQTIQHGIIKPRRRYAVFTSSLDGNASRNFAFNLPLTAMAWQRIGFDSVIIIVGDPEQHKHERWVEYLMETLIGKEYIVLLVLKTVTPDQATTISQVSRLFAASLVKNDERGRTMDDDVYLLTADADIWPIDGDFFDLPPGKDILHGNIGTTRVNGVQVIHAPLSYVGMNIRTWYDVMTQSGSLAMPNTTAEIIDYFGADFRYRVTHGGPGWHLDQQTISLRLHQWKAIKGNERRVHAYERQLANDRIDRSSWPPVNRMNIERAIDAHVLQHSYRPEQWRRLRPLLVMLFPDSDLLKRWDQYARTFSAL